MTKENNEEAVLSGRTSKAEEEESVQKSEVIVTGKAHSAGGTHLNFIYIIYKKKNMFKI